MEKMHFRRAFVDDPKTFRRYVPIAEEMLSLTDRCEGLNARQRIVMEARITGEDKFDTAAKIGISTSSVLRDEYRALAKIERMDRSLVESFKIIRKTELPRESIEKRRRAHFRSAEYKRRRRKYLRRYTFLHHDRLRKYDRELYARLAADAEWVRKQKEYYARPKVIKYRDRVTETAKKMRKECRPHIKVLRAPKKYGSEVVVKSLLFLGWRRNRYAFRFILPLLSSDDVPIRNEAVWAFSEQKEIRAVPGLLGLAKRYDTKNDGIALMKVVSALGHIGTVAAFKGILQYVRHPDPLVRNKALEVLPDFVREGAGFVPSPGPHAKGLNIT